MNNREHRRYSEAFKHHIVKEIESGGFENLEHMRQKYGIGGGSTINTWLRKYSKEHMLPRKVRIEMPQEVDQIKQLKKRIKELEKALVNAQVGSTLDQAYFEILCEQMGITDVAGYKKKIEKKLLDEAE